MRNDSLTEGARRALDQAASIASRERAAQRQPIHLLWALLGEESHAHESLHQAGLTRARLQERAPLSAGVDVEIPIAGSPDHAEVVPDSEQIREVVAHASKVAALRGGQVPIGTDDLLLALTAVESPVSVLLADFGITSTQAAMAEITAVAPLDADVQIRWQAATDEDRTRTLRIVDAAANRAREGLRVAEDYARLGLDDAHLTGRLKRCRHALREALSCFDAIELLRSRETQDDVGTRILVESETVRHSSADVARAAFKRAQEAVRSLEEFAKLGSPTAAPRLEKLRYELYTLEKSVALTEINGRLLADHRLYVLASEDLCPHGLGPAIRGALGAGVRIVQLREKDVPDRRLLELARRVRDWTREFGALFIMNDRPDLAVLAEADGVHVGQGELTVKDARSIVGPGRIVGVSTHSIEQARQAVLDGADYIGVGPVFASGTKSFAALAGLDLVRQVAAEIRLPWFAIGGIDAENIDSVVAAGAQRVAVSGAVCRSEDPQNAAAALLARLQK